MQRPNNAPTVSYIQIAQNKTNTVGVLGDAQIQLGTDCMNYGASTDTTCSFISKMTWFEVILEVNIQYCIFLSKFNNFYIS